MALSKWRVAITFVDGIDSATIYCHDYQFDARGLTLQLHDDSSAGAPQRWKYFPGHALVEVTAEQAAK